MHPTTPSARFDIAGFGELVSDPSRVAMLLSLLDGLARPASELARIAGVAASTASAHLGRLVSGGLLRAEQSGRHRYFRLSSDAVADLLEGIAQHAVPVKRQASVDPARVALSRARTCYKHLAGQLGVAWLATLESQRLLRVRDGGLALAPRGVERFERLGLTLDVSTAGKPCLDWTERRNHLGGPLGTLLTEHLLALRWLKRQSDGRALRVTTLGRAGLGEFGIAPALLG